MPSAASPNPRAGSAPPDDLDRLLDYDNAVDEFLRDIPVGNDDQNNTASGSREQPRDEDQEVQVKKKRKPVPKLDDNLLLSRNGIPKLRKIAKTRLKFRGKGNEFSDISRMLNTYQLWLDDLYPRAKFRDALTLVEKVGHSKRMQVMRRAWLDETKPHMRELTPGAEAFGTIDNGADLSEDRNTDAVGGDPSAIGTDDAQPTDNAHDQAAVTNEAPEDDELDLLLAAQGLKQAQVVRSERGPFEEEESDQEEQADDQPPEDELDALMAEHSAIVLTSNSSKIQPEMSDEDREHDFADDEDAMASMGW